MRCFHERRELARTLRTLDYRIRDTAINLISISMRGLISLCEQVRAQG